MQTTLINLTPYAIKVSGANITIEPSGYIARLNSHIGQVGEVNGIPLLEVSESVTTNIPEPKKNTMYIVPAIVRSHLKARQDLISPAKLIRDSLGAIVGCSAFEKNPK